VTETASGPTAEDVLDRNLRFASTAVEKGFLSPEQIMELVSSDELTHGSSIESVVQNKNLLSAAQVVEILQAMGEEPAADVEMKTGTGEPPKEEEPAPPPPVAPTPPPPEPLPPAPTDLDPSVTRLHCKACGAKLKIRNYVPTKRYNCPMCKAVLPPPAPTPAAPLPASETRPPTVRTVVKGPSPFVKKPEPPKAPAAQSQTQKLKPVAPKEPEPAIEGLTMPPPVPKHPEPQSAGISASRLEKLRGMAKPDAPVAPPPPPPATVEEPPPKTEEAVPLIEPPKAELAEEVAPLPPTPPKIEEPPAPTPTVEEPPAPPPPKEPTPPPKPVEPPAPPPRAVTPPPMPKVEPTPEPEDEKAEEVPAEEVFSKAAAEPPADDSNLSDTSEVETRDAKIVEDKPTREVPILQESASDPSTAMTQQIPKRRSSWLLITLLVLSLLALGYLNLRPIIEREIHLHNARNAFAAGQYQEAHDLCVKAIELGAKDADTLKLRDDCVEKLKGPPPPEPPPPPDPMAAKLEQARPLVAQAQQSLDAALALRKTDARSWNSAEWTSQLTAAIETTSQALSIIKDYPPALAVRGRTRVLLGRREAGLQDLQTASEAAPENASIRFTLGLCHLEQLMADLDRAGDSAELAWVRRGQEAARAQLLKLLEPTASDDAYKRRVEAIRTFFEGKHEETIRICEEAGAESKEFYFWIMAAAQMERGHFDAAIRTLQAGLQAAPFDIQLLSTASRALQELNQAKDLVDVANRALEIQSANALMIRRHGWALIELDLSDDGLRELARAIEKAESDPIGYTMRARAYMKLNRPQDALADLTQALKLDASFDPGYAWRSVVQAMLGQQEAADEDLKKMEERDASSALLFFARAQVLLIRKDTSGALEALNKFVEQKPSTEALLLRAKLRQEQGDAKGADEDLTRVIERAGARADVYFRRAAARRSLGDAAGEMADLNRALELDAKLGRAYFARAQRHAADNKIDDAVNDLRRAEENGVTDAGLFLLRGQLREGREDWKGASEDYTRALDRDAKNHEALMGRARVRDRMNDTPGAIEDLSRLIQEDEKNFEAMLLRGTLRGKAGDPIGALDDFGKSVALKPDDPRALFERGAARFRQGDWELAIQDLTKSLAGNDKNAQAVRLRGESLMKMERYADALKDLQRAVELDPTLEPSLKPLIEEAKTKSGY
jgi:tetratricopeptide (TPR) repeat protein